jgi:hypothetical protein
MFAGKVKLSTFLIGLGTLSLATCGGVSLFLGTPETSPAKPMTIAHPVTAEANLASSGAGNSPSADRRTHTPQSSPSAPASGTQSIAADAMTQEVLSWQGRNIQTDKIKDASTGSSYKLNVYQDAGEPTVNRVKVDLDRDEKWDEKYTFKGTDITRQVAPADDEQYSQTYHWRNGTWVPE